MPKTDPVVRFSLVVGYVVTFVWATTFIVGLVDPKRGAPGIVSGVMTIVATGAFGIPLFRKRSGEK